MAHRLGQLHRLAQDVGLQTAYYDVAGRRITADPQSLMAVLRALGVDVPTWNDVPGQLQDRRQEKWRQGVEPVTVLWDGQPGHVTLRLPQSQANGRVIGHLQLETGETRRLEFDLSRIDAEESHETKAGRYLGKTVRLPADLPWGYHHLHWDFPESRRKMLVLSAPRQAYGDGGKTWGTFLPLYTLHSQRSWGAGDFTDLERLITWVADSGGSTVATLPLLASYLSEPFDPSPYGPVSRLFWNEFYIDVTRIPELADCAEARQRLESDEVAREIADLRNAELVDYRRQMALKRRILETLAEHFFSKTPPRFAEFRQFLAERPDVEDYARFRATREKQAVPWFQWRQSLQDGEFQPGDYEETARRFYLYAQWIASQQLADLSETARQSGAGLYLDLPLGVGRDSFDVWQNRRQFVEGVTAGSPPDPVFTKGQNWGFAPLHPEVLREQHYRHFITLIRHHLRRAKLLRIDHVMGLHRLFCIPQDATAEKGVYLRYHAEELYAILSLESHRHRASIVGENLGTVPSYVNRAMSQHNIRRMYVVQYECRPEQNHVLNRIPRGGVASLNTHDMPPFSAFWNGEDLDDRLQLGLLEDGQLQAESDFRRQIREALTNLLTRQGFLEDDTPDEEDVMQACLAFLADSNAWLVLVNLEDLWLEARPQNIPGTGLERPNWQRRAKYSFEEFCRLPGVVATLSRIAQQRSRQND